MNKILTVLVPAYNAEAYIRKNLNSLCVQEIMDEIEVLIINDGSTDRTSQIAEEYVCRYPDSFRLINKKNGGHGSGINWGIQNATGEYFKVVDADDWVEKRAFIRLVRSLREQMGRRRPADIVSSGFLWAIEDRKADKKSRNSLAGFRLKAETREPFHGVKYGRTYLFDEIAEKLYIKMHNMTIRTEILRKAGVEIDEHCCYVDSEYVTYPIPWVSTICFVDAFVYRYRIGRAGQSVELTQMRRNAADYDQVIASLLGFYGKCGTEIPCSAAKKRYIAGMIAHVVSGKIKTLLSFPASLERKSELRDFDRRLRNDYPIIYSRNNNLAISALRASRYLLYHPVSILVRLKYS